MSFISSETILEKLCDHIQPFDNKRVKYGAYELSLGKEVFITDEKQKRKLNEGDLVKVPPGQFALLITEEIIQLPPSLIGFISLKYSYKKKGLINISGFHVDPGFYGKLKFSVYNAGTKNIYLRCGEPIFPIWFAKFETECERYDGNHKNQFSIDNNDLMDIEGDVVSPNTLKEQIKELNHKVDSVSQLLKIVIATLVPIIFTVILSNNSGCNCSEPTKTKIKVTYDSTEEKKLSPYKEDTLKGTE